MLSGEQVQHAHSGQGRARLCWHRDGEPTSGDEAGTHRDKTVTEWDSLGLCLLRLILVLRPPHRGLLAAACPSQILHWLGGAELAGNSAPAEKTTGLLSLFCSSAYVVTQRKVGTPQNVVTHPTESIMAPSHPHWQWLRVLKQQPTQT